MNVCREKISGWNKLLDQIRFMWKSMFDLKRLKINIINLQRDKNAPCVKNIGEKGRVCKEKKMSKK